MAKRPCCLAEEIADVIGQEALARLVRHFGGARLTVPAQPRAGELAEVLGAAYPAFQTHFAGEAFDVPLLITVRVQELRVLDALDQGLSADRIAPQMRISRRRVFRIQARAARYGWGRQMVLDL